MKRLVRILLAFIGLVIAVAIVGVIEAFVGLGSITGTWRVALYIAVGILGGLIFFFFSPNLVKTFNHYMEVLTAHLEKVPLSDIIIAVVGLLVGLLIASLISMPVLQLSMAVVGNAIGVVLSVFIYLVCGILGIRIALKNREEILGFFRQIKETTKDMNSKKSKKKLLVKKDEHFVETYGKAKILDTSVIIDGRIFEIIRLGFLEGPFIISHYVLHELQHISDSADSLKRGRGRKGLDSINDFQKNRPSEIIIDKQKIDDVEEVDSKLLLITESYDGCIVTNDFNLNKVAKVQKIPVLNVNELANALKPIVIPGEHLIVEIIKEGKELEQGIGYLDDGTMIVIENGREYLGQTVETVVTSVLQTAAGKMIFSRVQ